MVLIGMLLWVTAAVVLWRRAEAESASQYWRWLAIAVAMPLVAYAVGRALSKHVWRW
jgi:hypothetical protein